MVCHLEGVSGVQKNTRDSYEYLSVYKQCCFERVINRGLDCNVQEVDTSDGMFTSEFDSVVYSV